MTQALILAAGLSSRLGGAWKPRVRVAGREVYNWQFPLLPEHKTVVARSCEFPLPGADFIAFDGLGGPVKALRVALEFLDDEDLVVCFSDTIWQGDLPSTPGWVGVAQAGGGRVWDTCDNHGRCSRAFVPEGVSMQVCIGLYHFDDLAALKEACDVEIGRGEPETHMWQVVNHFHMRPHPFRWHDVGDPAAIAAAELALAETTEGT